MENNKFKEELSKLAQKGESEIKKNKKESKEDNNELLNKIGRNARIALEIISNGERE